MNHLTQPRTPNNSKPETASFSSTKFKAAIKVTEDYNAVKKSCIFTFFIFSVLAITLLYTYFYDVYLPVYLEVSFVFVCIFSLSLLSIFLVALSGKKHNMNKLARNPGWMDSSFVDTMSGVNANSLIEVSPKEVKHITSEKIIINEMQEKAINQALKGHEISYYLRKLPVIQKLLKKSYQKIDPV